MPAGRTRARSRSTTMPRLQESRGSFRLLQAKDRIRQLMPGMVSPASYATSLRFTTLEWVLAPTAFSRPKCKLRAQPAARCPELLYELPRASSRWRNGRQIHTLVSFTHSLDGTVSRAPADRPARMYVPLHSNTVADDSTATRLRTGGRRQSDGDHQGHGGRCAAALQPGWQTHRVR